MTTQNMTTINVPENMVDQVLQYMTQLNMQENNLCGGNQFGLDTTNIETDDTREYVVVEVVGHRIINGNWQFNLRFDGYTETEWTDDDDCDCELFIQNYMIKININTIYVICRVSTDEQSGDTHVSLSFQETNIRREINEMYPNQNYRVVVYAFSGSAYKNIPITIENIGIDCRSGDKIIVWKIDRLGRNLNFYMPWLEKLQKDGVDVYSCVEKIWYSSSKALFLRYLLEAQQEAETLSLRVKTAYAYKKDRGDHIGSAPYGKKLERIYNNEGNISCIVLSTNDEEVKIINRIRGLSGTYEKMAEKLNKEGIKKRKRKWSGSMVRNIYKG